MQLRLAQWTVDLQVNHAALANAIAPRYADFISLSPAQADLVVEVTVTPGEEGRNEDSVSILQTPLLAIGEDYGLDGGHFYGMITPARGRAELRIQSGAHVYEVDYFLRIALALFAFHRDGLLVHCAALKRGNVVQLFVGQSGSGKSTVVALSRAAGRATALNDDFILLRRRSDAWSAYGTPFWNYETTNRDGQSQGGLVAGIYKLVQDSSVFVEPMARTAATAELVASCPIVNAQVALLPTLIDRCRDIADTITVQRLHFRKDDAFWELIPQEGP